MKRTYIIIGLLAIIGLIWYAASRNNPEDTQINSIQEEQSALPVEITPISHATAILRWGDTIIYTDPTGGTTAFQNQPAADIILLTDIHGDHLSTSTLSALTGSSTIIAPQAVRNLLPQQLASRVRVMNNGDIVTEQDLSIAAIPMYNLPESADSRHTKGRGNGYIIEKDGFRVYIAGDTAGTPEMRSLTDIDIAFVPMNLPFTMDVDEAADAVLDFKPRQVYPYHYRGQNGLSDVNRFKQLVNAGDPSIEVILLDWYPEQ